MFLAENTSSLHATIYGKKEVLEIFKIFSFQNIYVVF